AIFGQVLERAADRHPIVGSVRGRGLLLGIELVRDRRSRAPADDQAARVQEQLREHGVIVGRSGQYHNVLRVNPPLCVTSADAALFGDALETALASL
ncbi:MAG: aminotransferase class III-fold pyridoxal phosphate-dependent enzyme, partial [Lautropia sp.]